MHYVILTYIDQHKAPTKRAQAAFRVGAKVARICFKSLLEEEVLPALKSCLARVAELDEQILSEMEILPHCLLEDERIQIAKLRPALG